MVKIGQKTPVQSESTDPIPKSKFSYWRSAIGQRIVRLFKSETSFVQACKNAWNSILHPCADKKTVHKVDPQRVSVQKKTDAPITESTESYTGLHLPPTSVQQTPNYATFKVSIDDDCFYKDFKVDKNNEVDGFGQCEYDDGTFLRGNFKQGYLVQGKCEYKDGTVYEGKFENRYLVKGTKTYPEGHELLSEEGSFKEGKLDGFGTRTFVNGEVLEGKFKEGNRVQ